MEERVRDGTGYRLRAGVYVFRGSEVLLVASASRPGALVVPAGGLLASEANEEAGTRAAALRELEEEAGVHVADPTGLLALCWLHDHAKRSRTALFAYRGAVSDSESGGDHARAWLPAATVGASLAASLQRAATSAQAGSAGAQLAAWRACEEALVGAAEGLPPHTAPRRHFVRSAADNVYELHSFAGLEAAAPLPPNAPPGKAAAS